MRAFQLISWLPAVLLATGCVTQPASYDYDKAVDFAKYRHWTWLPHPEKQASGDPRVDNPLTRKRIESAISRNLDARGYRQSDAEMADFRVGYLVTVRKVPSSTTVGGSIGFGRYRGGSGIGISIGGPAVPLNDYEKGTLFIDMRDSRTDDLAWRGSSTGQLDPFASPEESQQRINTIVDEILKNFPPGKES